MRRCRGNRGIRTGLPRGRRSHRHALAVRGPGCADSRCGQDAGRARLTVSAGAHGFLHPRHSRRGPYPPDASSGARRMRLGRIPWINAAPVYAAIDDGIVTTGAEVISATAAELNDLLAAGELDLSVISAVEYARDAAAYHLLPDLAISCDGPVHSVALFSKRPVRELDRATVLRTASSRTSHLLLELLCRHV